MVWGINKCTKSFSMAKSKLKYDLEERTFEFALSVRTYIRNIRRNYDIQIDIQPLIRSSGSVGANYIEANESLGRKDFLMRIRICLKEVKETTYWLKLIQKSQNKEYDETVNDLLKEALELKTSLQKLFKTPSRKSKFEQLIIEF